VRADPLALGDLAVQALRSDPLPATPADFSCVLASILPDARARLIALSATRHGAEIAAPARRFAVHELTRAAHHADRARDAGAAALAAQALGALRHEMPVGLERRLGRLLHEGAREGDLAAGIVEQIAPALRAPGPSLAGTPKLLLVAAIVLAGRCPTA
jgi:hypothetical protein